MKRMCQNLAACVKFADNKKVPYFVSVTLSSLLVSFCYNIVLAIIMQKVLDALAGKDMLLFREAMIWAFLTFGVAFLLEPVFTKMKNNTVSSMMEAVRKDIVENVTCFQVQAYENGKTADIITRATQDVEKLENIYISHIPNLFFAIIHGGMASIIMLIYDVRMGLLALCVGFIHTKINFVIAKRIEENAQKRQAKYSLLLASVVEALDGKVDIIMSQARKYFCNLFEKRVDDLYETETETEKEIRKTENVENFFQQISNVLIMVLGLCFVLRGSMTVGVVAAIISLQGNAEYLFQNISSFSTGLAETMPSMDRILEVLGTIKDDEKMEKVTKEENCEVRNTEKNVPALEIKDLSFAYAGENKLFEGISWKIPHGKFVILSGESGKGKSTLGKILLRFYTQTTGDYYVYGRKAKEDNLKQIREQIAYVDQNCFLFSMSVRDNLRLVRENATDEEIMEACKIAQAHDFIMELPGNYDYKISTGHDNLSGGQKQRLALARMILSDRDIFLLDEGTAGLDAETERKFVESLKEKYENKKNDSIYHTSQIFEEICRYRVYLVIKGCEKMRNHFSHPLLQ